ncbi:MAG: hypothetical protein ACFCVB_13745, partial [Nodosilinea sp.]
DGPTWWCGLAGGQKCLNRPGDRWQRYWFEPGANQDLPRSTFDLHSSGVWSGRSPTPYCLHWG